MALIKSISGIRGTIGGLQGENLTPADVVKYTAAFGQFIKERHVDQTNVKIVVGRDSRPSGRMIRDLVAGTLVGMGIDVVDLEMVPTPTVEIAVTEEAAQGGIIITASHNPGQWNALKLLNEEGEFLSASEGNKVLDLAESQGQNYVHESQLGSYRLDDSYVQKHIEKILSLSMVDVKAISEAKMTVAIDGINSVGSIAIPLLLDQLGVEKVTLINGEPTGKFQHNPEPLPENLEGLSKLVVETKADVGFAVDPDVDRLAIILEDGKMFGEEYTLVAVADYVLQSEAGSTVSNLSSTLALKEITEKAGGLYYASAVGEVNVVALMKEHHAIIGGEGNGGVIFPALHYGRDSLVGIALFLTFLAKSGQKCSVLRSQYPNYCISKKKMVLDADLNTDKLFQKISEKYKDQPQNRIDGVRIEFHTEWVHLRKSNTEPIIRIYAESDTPAKADDLANKIMNDIYGLLNR